MFDTTHDTFWFLSMILFKITAEVNLTVNSHFRRGFYTVLFNGSLNRSTSKPHLCKVPFFGVYPSTTPSFHEPLKVPFKVH